MKSTVEPSRKQDKVQIPARLINRSFLTITVKRYGAKDTKYQAVLNKSSGFDVSMKIRQHVLFLFFLGKVDLGDVHVRQFRTTPPPITASGGGEGRGCRRASLRKCVSLGTETIKSR